MSRRPLIAGNWKMNGSRAALAELSAMVDDLRTTPDEGFDVLVCPPAILVAQAAEIAQGVVAVGGQDAHAKASGAHTGDVSAAMLKDAGASHVILGHSERRTDHGEASELVAAKTEGAWAAGLVAVVCIGETEAEKNAGRTLDVLADQIRRSLPEGATADNTVVAYEPVWAIGTGRTPTVAEVGETHAFIRARLAERFGADAAAGMRVLYGGSVKPSNAAELLALEDVDGALVGGASLKAADFLPICRAARN
ncbi:triose-phosphate isomerase [Aureimonas sp. SK2]|uniref:triose-phosphate isomerase n=1 Tax=Aureimonas sp. SK2 TaxID=3015992 RepID=UPI0024437E7A|nr:triose-phosphate isomerase [Aureimonas sp. SK2]